MALRPAERRAARGGSARVGLACFPAIVAAVVLLAGAPFAGCAANSSSSNPRDALRDYALALREGRTADAYSLLSRDARARLSREEFSRMVAENGREIEELSAQLLKPAAPSELTARLSSPDGEELLLVYEAGGWRVDASALDLYGQATPIAALQSFVRAFDNKRYDILMRFVPDAKRHGLSEEQLERAWEGEQREQVERLTQALKASLPNLRVELLGTRATVSYGAGGTVELVHEQGDWKVEDF